MLVFRIDSTANHRRNNYFERITFAIISENYEKCWTKIFRKILPRLFPRQHKYWHKTGGCLTYSSRATAMPDFSRTFWKSISVFHRHTEQATWKNKSHRSAVASVLDTFNPIDNKHFFSTPSLSSDGFELWPCEYLVDRNCVHLL